MLHLRKGGRRDASKQTYKIAKLNARTNRNVLAGRTTYGTVVCGRGPRLASRRRMTENRAARPPII